MVQQQHCRRCFCCWWCYCRFGCWNWMPDERKKIKMWKKIRPSLVKRVKEKVEDKKKEFVINFSRLRWCTFFGNQPCHHWVHSFRSFHSKKYLNSHNSASCYRFHALYLTAIPFINLSYRKLILYFNIFSFQVSQIRLYKFRVGISWTRNQVSDFNYFTCFESLTNSERWQQQKLRKIYVLGGAWLRFRQTTAKCGINSFILPLSHFAWSCLINIPSRASRADQSDYEYELIVFSLVVRGEPVFYTRESYHDNKSSFLSSIPISLLISGFTYTSVNCKH